MVTVASKPTQPYCQSIPPGQDHLSAPDVDRFCLTGENMAQSGGYRSYAGGMAKSLLLPSAPPPGAVALFR
jgi:hypothetical protein